MDELDLAVGPAEADIAPAGLIIPGVGYGGNLLVAVHGGDLNFNVVGSGHGGGAIARRQLHGAEVEAQALHQILGLTHQLIEGGVGILGPGELEHLHLVELVAPDHASLVGPVGAGLPAEAGGVGEELSGKLRLRQDFIPVNRGQSGFGGGEHIVDPVVGWVGDFVYLVGELGELTGGLAALVLQHMGRQDELIAVGDVGVDEVVQQRPLQPGAHALVDPEAGTGQLGAPVIIDQAQIQAQIHMVLGGEVKLVGFAEVAQGLVVLLAAGGQIGIRQIGQGQHQRPVLRQHRVQLGGVLGNAGLQLRHLLEDGGHVLAGLLHGGDLLGNLVLPGLPGFGVGDQCPALLVQLQDPVNGGVAVHLLGPQTGLHRLGIVFDASDV